MAEKQEKKIHCIADAVGKIPYRMAFAGGWIDQPFVSRMNPDLSGSMVVVNIHPDFRFMDRCGMATSSRKVAAELWGEHIPDTNPEELVRELYRTENKGLADPSGSQDMIGLVYPGINRLDYSADYEGGYFPVHIESNNDPDIARWIEEHIKMVPVCPRPAGYNPLEIQNITPDLVQQLGRTGRECYDAILAKDKRALGHSMNHCMQIWEALMPGIVLHHTLSVDLKAVLKGYQSEFYGAMYSGCGGGYLYVVADGPVPGGIAIRVRTDNKT